MKRILLAVLPILLLLSLTSCRRRIMADAEQVIQETYLQETPETMPTEPPTEPPTEQTEATEPPEPAVEQPSETDATAAPEPSEETVPGKGETEPEPTEPTEKVSVTVRFEPNHGSCGQESATVTVGDEYGSLPTAERDGFTFTGWYDRKNGGNRIDGATIVTTAADHTLYAHWSARSGYAVTFDANGGRLASDAAERLVYVGDTYGELPVPIRRGYDFSGWFTEAESGSMVQASDVFTAGSEQVLYAHWSYNPFDYWSFFLENTTQQIYSCQQKSVYVEFDEDHITTNYCSLISATGSYNVAQNREDMTVTDDWVLEKNPDVIIKLVSDMGSAASAYSAMSARFPGYRVLVLPSTAVYGSDAQVLYYRIAFGKQLYPEWYTEADMDTVSAELGASGSIYG